MEMKKTTYTAFDNRNFNALPLSRGWWGLRLGKLKNTFSTISSIYHPPPPPLLKCSELSYRFQKIRTYFKVYAKQVFFIKGV